MKKFIFATLALSIALPALADKVEVNNEILKEINDAQALDLARVYLSHTVKIERSSALKKVSEVEEGVSRVVRQNILKEEIGKKVRGKIIAVENQDTEVGSQDTVQALVAGLKTIYVSFDKSCLQKECAYAFRLPGDFRTSNYNWKYYFQQGGSYFALSDIPAVPGMEITKLTVHRTILSDPQMRKDGNTYYANGKSVKLMIDLSELREITINKVKYGGF